MYCFCYHNNNVSLIFSGDSDVSPLELVFDFIASQFGQDVNLLASTLGIEYNHLERLEMEYPRNPQEKNFHILFMWKSLNPQTDHIAEVKKALKSLDRNDLDESLSDFKKDLYKCEGVVNGTEKVESRDLTIVSRELAGNSYRLGRFLGVPQSRISQIKEDNVKDIVEQTFLILDWWRKYRHEQATRQDLCDGLLYIGQRNVVDILNKKWQSK